MPPAVSDVLKANVVFVGIELLNSQESVDKFQTFVGSEVVREGLLVGGGPGITPSQGHIFRLHRDRIFLQCSSVRSIVEREYPARQDLTRLTDVTHCAIQNTDMTDQSLAAFGFNIDMVFDQSSGKTALKYLADRLFSTRIHEFNDWPLIGGSGKLVFEEGANQWTVTAEPRFGDEKTTKVYLGINSHFNQHELPDRSAMLSSLCETWDKALTFLGAE